MRQMYAYYTHQHNLVCVFVLSQPWMQRVVRCTNYNAAEIILWGLAAKLREKMLLLGSCRQAGNLAASRVANICCVALTVEKRMSLQIQH